MRWLFLQQSLRNYLPNFDLQLWHMITAMLLTFSTLRIANLGKMIVVINTTRTITLIIITTIPTIVAYHGKESVMFVAKKVVALIDTQKLNNRRQKSFEDKTKNFVEKMINTTHFWSIIKGTQTITMIMKKVIIQTTMMDTLCNLI